jgi:hypothetical protein
MFSSWGEMVTEVSRIVAMTGDLEHLGLLDVLCCIV